MAWLHNRAAARATTDAVRLEHVAVARLDVVLETATAYLDVLLAERLLTLARSDLARAEDLAHKARRGRDVGGAPLLAALRAEEISSERDYLAARQELAEARIRRRAAEQMLLALAVAADGLDGPHLHHDGFDISHYRLTAPMSGTVIDRHATLGEMLSVAEPAFLVADLDTVWVDLATHVQDLVRLHPGQMARVRAITRSVTITSAFRKDEGTSALRTSW